MIYLDHLLLVTPPPPPPPQIFFFKFTLHTQKIEREKKREREGWKQQDQEKNVESQICTSRIISDNIGCFIVLYVKRGA